MDIAKFYDSISTGDIQSDIKIGSFRRLVAKYPYFQASIFAYLKALFLSEDEGYEDELERLSIFINDRKALFFYVFSEDYKDFLERTSRDSLPEDKTKALLDAFFSTYSGEEALNDEIELETNIVSADYLSFLNAQPDVNMQEEEFEDNVPMKHQDIIDSFIQKSEDIQLPPLSQSSEYSNNGEDYDIEDEEESGEDDQVLNEDIFFTETLAKIYIRQKKYEKAYKIIQHLSLNYPKKNTYFADQLSFIEKLIINTKHKNKK